MKKKLLAILLVTLMIVGMLPITAWVTAPSTAWVAAPKKSKKPEVTPQQDEYTGQYADNDNTNPTEESSELEYSLVIPTETTLTDEAHKDVILGGKEGKVSINVTTDNAKTKVYYTVDLKNATLTNGENNITTSYTYAQGGDYTALTKDTKVTVYEGGNVKDSTIKVTADEKAWESAPYGEYSATLTFNFATEKAGEPEEQITKQRINFKGVSATINAAEVSIDYFPVFSECGDVEFYDNEGTQYTSMNPAITYALVPEGTTVYAIRSVNESWDNVFFIEGEDGYPRNASGVKDSFITSYLVGGNEDTEKVLCFNGNPGGPGNPDYNGVSLSDIWSVYKGNGSFLPASYAYVLSATEYANTTIICWNCSLSSWGSTRSTSKNDNYVCIFREFTVSTEQ